MDGTYPPLCLNAFSPEWGLNCFGSQMGASICPSPVSTKSDPLIWIVLVNDQGDWF